MNSNSLVKYIIKYLNTNFLRCPSYLCRSFISFDQFILPEFYVPWRQWKIWIDIDLIRQFSYQFRVSDTCRMRILKEPLKQRLLRFQTYLLEMLKQTWHEIRWFLTSIMCKMTQLQNKLNITSYVQICLGSNRSSIL